MGMTMEPKKRKMSFDEFMNAPVPPTQKRKISFEEFMNAPAPASQNSNNRNATHVKNETRTLSEATADSFGLDKNLERGTIIPLGRDKETGEYELALPQLAVDAMEGFMLPSHAYKGGDYTIEDTMKFAAPATGTAAGVKPLAKTVAKPAKFTKKQLNNIPTSKDLRGDAKKLYGQVDQSGDTVGSDKFSDVLLDMEDMLFREGFDPDVHPKVKSVFNSIAKRQGAKMDLAELRNVRKLASNAASSNDPSEKRLGLKMLDRINGFIDETQGEGARLLKEADKAYAKSMRVKTLESALKRAEGQASGEENGIRIELRKILNNEKKSKYFSAEEKAAMQEVVQGKAGANIARFVSNFGPSADQRSNSLLTVLSAGLGGTLGGIPGAVAPMVAGNIGGRVATKLTKKGADQVKALAAGMKPKTKTSAKDPAVAGRVIGSQAVQVEPWQMTRDAFLATEDDRKKTPRDVKATQNAFLRKLPN